MVHSFKSKNLGIKTLIVSGIALAVLLIYFCFAFFWVTFQLKVHGRDFADSYVRVVIKPVVKILEFLTSKKDGSI